MYGGFVLHMVSFTGQMGTFSVGDEVLCKVRTVIWNFGYERDMWAFHPSLFKFDTPTGCHYVSPPV